MTALIILHEIFFERTTNILYNLFRSCNRFSIFKGSYSFIYTFNFLAWKYGNFGWNWNHLVFTEWKKIRSFKIFCSKIFQEIFKNFPVDLRKKNLMGVLIYSFRISKKWLEKSYG